MSQVMLARVTCPNCSNQFQAPVEQILDVGTDPNAKMRVLNGLVNVLNQNAYMGQPVPHGLVHEPPPIEND